MSSAIPSAQAISPASIPRNDPSTPLSPALYKFIFLLVGVILFFWIIKLVFRARRIWDLWVGIREESVVRVEGPGVAIHLNRDSLFAILRARSVHQVREAVRIHVPAHITPSSCKVVRPQKTVHVAPVDAPAAATATSTTALPAESSASPQFYQLSLLLTATSVVKLDVYVGVPVKLVQLLHRAHEKFLSRGSKPKKVKSPTGARQGNANGGNEIELTAIGPTSTLSLRPPAKDDEERKQPASPTDQLHTKANGEHSAPSPPISAATEQGSEQEHSAFLRAYILESMAAAGAHAGLFREEEFKWKSNTFVIQPPPAPATGTTRPLTPGGGPHTPKNRGTPRSRKHTHSSGTSPLASTPPPGAFQQTFHVSIPLAVLQRACRDVNLPARHTFPIVIHASTIDSGTGTGVNGGENGKSSAKKSNNKQATPPYTVSEITLCELAPNVHALAAAAASGSPATPAAEHAAGVPSSPASPSLGATAGGEDFFLSKLKFEKQLVILSAPGGGPLPAVIPTGGSSSKHSQPPMLSAVYDLEELYGLHTSIKLPDATAIGVGTGTDEPAVVDDPSNNDQTNNECVVCMSEVKDIILLPCRHVCLCHTCHENVTKCPVCRAPILSHMRFQYPQQNKKKIATVRKAHTTRAR